MLRAAAAGLVGVIAWPLATVYPLESDAATEAELQSAVFRAKPAVVMIAVRIGATATVHCGAAASAVVRPGAPTEPVTSEQETERLARIYSAQARVHAERWSSIIRAGGLHLLEALAWRGAKRVLDIGTGAGAHLPDLRRLPPDAWVLGVDRSRGMLDLARPQRIPLALMDGMDLALRAQSFDVAVMIFVLFHLPDPLNALRGVRRVLRPGGTLGLVTWAEDPDVEASQVWDAELDALGAREPEPILRQHELMNTTDKMASLLSDAGLTTVKLWIERLEHTWDVEGLFALHTGFGRAKRKLDSLNGPTRIAFLERIRGQLAGLPEEAFRYRGTVVCSVACRPA